MNFLNVVSVRNTMNRLMWLRMEEIDIRSYLFPEERERGERNRQIETD